MVKIITVFNATNNRTLRNPTERDGIMTVRSVYRRTSALFIALAIAVAVAITPSGTAQAAVPRNTIWNISPVGIGVWHDNHGGTYDAILPGDSDTRSKWGWDHASKVYIGPTFCAGVYSSPKDVVNWTLKSVVRGPVIVPTAYTSDWLINASAC